MIQDTKGRICKGNVHWNKGKKGIHLSRETEFKIGSKWSDEKKKIWSDRAKERGFGKWMIGRKPKFLEDGTHHVAFGKDHPNWRGGITYAKYGRGFNKSLKEKVRFRDGYKCQMCGCPQIENGRALDIHHIDYYKKNNSLKNLVSLCKHCHLKTTNGNRVYYKNLLRNMVVVLYLY